jgi:endo-1,4-beta-D-glucanase Y
MFRMRGSSKLPFGKCPFIFIMAMLFLACADQQPEKEFQVRLDKVLASSWPFYKRHYIQPDGRVKRLDNRNDTISEGQAYALLRSVWSRDQATFDRCFDWTARHLSQKKLVTPHPDPIPSRGEGNKGGLPFAAGGKGRKGGQAELSGILGSQVQLGNQEKENQKKDSNLLAWHWGQDGEGRWGVLDANSASDADLDYALALVLAHRQWGRPDYLAQAKLVLRDILARETCRDPWGRLWLTPGDWEACRQPLQLNPSYFSPAWYQLFFEVTHDQRWLELAESTYTGLDLMSRSLGKQPGVGLIPDWCLLNDFEQFTLAPDRRANFGWDAIRFPWRVGLAELWFGDRRSRNLLSRTFLPFCRSRLEADGRLYAIYDYAGKPLESYESPVLYASLTAAALAAGDRGLARQAAEKILSFYRETIEGGYFNRPDDYYGNNWAWFGLATYRGLVKP